jgi:probable F420-dependent oxidoreductase
VSVRIGLGIANFPFSSAQAFWRWVDLCEESDVDSIWCSDRLVTPLPFLEPMSAMAALAGRTQRLKFGMNAVVLPFRDPLVLAKECATIDYLSDGRLLPVFGVGADTAPEWKATGRQPEGRGAWSDEALEVMARLWSEPSVTYEGKHVSYYEVSISPRPVQQPLPLWIGGSSSAAIRRTARIGTGWLAGIQTPAQVAPVVRSIKQEAAKVGRSIDEDHYGAGFAYRFGAWDDDIVERTGRAYARIAAGFDLREAAAVGGARDIIARVQDYADAGVSKFVLRPMAEGDDEFVWQTQRLIEEVLPLVHS